MNVNLSQVDAAETRAKINAANEADAAAKLSWDDVAADHVLGQMSARVGELIKEADYNEMYGIELQAPAEGQATSPFQTLLILQKFLRANAGDVSKACDQLLGALKWRKEFKPLEVKEQVFSSEKYAGLGYVTKLKGVPMSKNKEDVCTFNIYGAVKDTKKTFGDLDDFMRWRVALMELTIQQLDLQNTTRPIPDFGQGPDPHQAIQIHDYLRVSFLRQPAEVKAASQAAIKLFTAHYPETLSKKYFVNVPLVMQWMFGAMSVFMAKETVDKMLWMSYGNELVRHLGESVGKEYGGKGSSLEEVGSTPKYDS